MVAVLIAVTIICNNCKLYSRALLLRLEENENHQNMADVVAATTAWVVSKQFLLFRLKLSFFLRTHHAKIIHN